MFFCTQWIEGDGTGLGVVKDEVKEDRESDGQEEPPETTPSPVKASTSKETAPPASPAASVSSSPGKADSFVPPPSPRSQAHRTALLDAVREMRRGTALIHNALSKLSRELESTPLYEVPDLLRQVIGTTQGKHVERMSQIFS